VSSAPPRATTAPANGSAEDEEEGHPVGPGRKIQWAAAGIPCAAAAGSATATWNPKTANAVFDAHHRVGEGFVNKNMGGQGPREAKYATTSVVRILIAIVPGSDPPEPFIMTTFPTALG